MYICTLHYLLFAIGCIFIDIRFFVLFNIIKKIYLNCNRQLKKWTI